MISNVSPGLKVIIGKKNIEIESRGNLCPLFFNHVSVCLVDPSVEDPLVVFLCVRG